MKKWKNEEMEEWGNEWRTKCEWKTNLQGGNYEYMVFTLKWNCRRYFFFCVCQLQSQLLVKTDGGKQTNEWDITYNI